MPQAFAVSTLMLLRTSPPLDWRRLCAAKVHDKRCSVSARPLKRFAIALFRNLISLSKGFVGGGAVWRSAERNEKDLNKE